MSSHTVYLFLITAAVGLLIACLWLLVSRFLLPCSWQRRAEI